MADDRAALTLCSETVSFADVVQNWLKAQPECKLLSVNSKPSGADQIEIALLPAELARVKRVREILEKATAFFA